MYSCTCWMLSRFFLSKKSWHLQRNLVNPDNLVLVTFLDRWIMHFVFSAISLSTSICLADKGDAIEWPSEMSGVQKTQAVNCCDSLIFCNYNLMYQYYFVHLIFFQNTLLLRETKHVYQRLSWILSHSIHTCKIVTTVLFFIWHNNQDQIKCIIIVNVCKT